MNAVIENTLHIISKVSSSRQGYLLQLNDHGYTVLNIWGGRIEDFTSLNDLLFKIFKAGGIDTEKVVGLPSISDFLKEKFFSSFFIKDIIFYSERNLFIYILLFSDNADEFRDESKSKILPILSILSHQVKSWIEQTAENSVVSAANENIFVDRKKIFNEWEDKFYLLIKTSPDLVFILDHSGKIILINDVIKNFLEYSPEEVKGKYFLEFINKEDASLVNSSFNSVLSERRAVKFNVNLKTKYGQLYPVELRCNVIAGNGKIIGMLGVGKDLSEKLRYEVELQKLKPKLTEINRLLNIERARVSPQKSVVEELNRLKYDFISSISHEFRTTLASIIGFSETIESDPDLAENMKEEFNRVIMSEGKRLAKLINYLLETSNSDDGLILINKTTIGVVKLIHDVIQANQEFASSKNITVTFEHPSEEIFIDGDAESLFQVFSALINNAIRFNDELGRVKLVVNNFVREVEIIISDTGIGIPEKDQPYIFQRFYQVSRRISEIPSTGVGLVFVKQIIDLHKGLITVQSEAGSGATFLVKLPKTSKIEKLR